MILPKHPLKLMRFDVLDAHMTYVSPSELLSEIDESKYIIDLDYEIKLSDKSIIIYTHILINDPKTKFPCHVMEVESVSVFEIELETLTEEIRDNIIQQSAVSISFNNLRGYIQNVTSYLPIGSYTLPLFTPHKLLEEKFLESQNDFAKKSTKKANKKKVNKVDKGQ